LSPHTRGGRKKKVSERKSSHSKSYGDVGETKGVDKNVKKGEEKEPYNMGGREGKQ